MSELNTPQQQTGPSLIPSSAGLKRLAQWNDRHDGQCSAEAWSDLLEVVMHLENEALVKDSPATVVLDGAHIAAVERELKDANQKVADAEELLVRVYDESVMTHGGTRDMWEGFHGAAEMMRAAREGEKP